MDGSHLVGLTCLMTQSLSLWAVISLHPTHSPKLRILGRTLLAQGGTYLSGHIVGSHTS